MLGILFAVIAAVGQGLGYALVQKSNKEFPSSIAYAVDALLGLFIWIPFALLVGVRFAELGSVFPIALLSALFAEAYVIYVYNKGDFNIATVVFALYPVSTIFFSRLIIHEQLSGVLFVACLVTVLGAAVTAAPRKFTRELARERLYVLWPLSAALIVGFVDTISKDVIDQTDAATFLFALAIAQVPVALCYLWMQKTKARTLRHLYRERYKYRFALAGAFLIVTTLIAFWLAYENTLASIASPLTNTYVIFALIGAHFLLGERLSLKDKIGVAITIAGVVGLGILKP